MSGLEAVLLGISAGAAAVCGPFQSVTTEEARAMPVYLGLAVACALVIVA